MALLVVRNVRHRTEYLVVKAVLGDYYPSIIRLLRGPVYSIVLFLVRPDRWRLNAALDLGNSQFVHRVLGKLDVRGRGRCPRLAGVYVHLSKGGIFQSEVHHSCNILKFLN